jgi:hypothetical protein
MEECRCRPKRVGILSIEQELFPTMDPGERWDVPSTRLLAGVPAYRGDLYRATEIEWLTRTVESKAG